MDGPLTIEDGEVVFHKKSGIDYAPPITLKPPLRERAFLCFTSKT
jgi:hypothetical protein